MSLRVVGAGFPRTGTSSLHNALMRLLGGRCYHMDEVFSNLEHVPIWRAAIAGEAPADWNRFLGGYSAAVDWPASAFWRDLAAANPDAPIILSVRRDPETWWRSADRTILQVARDADPKYGDWLHLFHELLAAQIGERWDDPRRAMAAYERHNEEVRRTCPPHRLVEWQPEDGWAPICNALGVEVPDEPFPHVNTTADWERGHDEAAKEAAVQ